MLALMVPGVGMGGLPHGAVPPGSGVRFLTMLGVGRVFVPFALSAELVRQLMYSDYMTRIFAITHLLNLG